MKEVFLKKYIIILLIAPFLVIGCKSELESAAKTENENQKNTINYKIEKIKNENFPSQLINIEKKLDYVKNKYQEYLISYKSDGLKIFGKMNIPDQEIPENGFPVVIINHGYIPPNKYDTDNSYRLVDGFFASSGFITLKSDYRGWNNSEKLENSVYNRLGLVRDIKYLLEAIPNIEEADENNVFVFGHSMGGEVTLKLLQTIDDNKLRAASLWAPCYEYYPEVSLYFIRDDGENEEMAQKRRKKILSYIPEKDFPLYSVTNYVNYIDIPIILHHGTMDKSVPFQWSLNLVEELKKHGKDYTFYSYKDDHNLSNNFFSVLARDVKFFKKNIQ
ncbi:MAG: prolyl oligopeptidase family serine peptidase [Candidatus Mcinerneyibacterium aminivorans]|uniref:Prolyl oligopeptidase family serine peptidase n=1 Tax=Candidatus Mcinerneyibacterium aminivorans TaxID=2703815 RepID=A0A5D0MKY3_9BACT|nr:MAG: prolyl oligopeptidase family serine peptidase [Candidatus Mcinerneyibacterium aminivorans]